MKKLLSVITTAAVLLGSTIAYASTSELVDETTVEAYADTADVENQVDLLEYTELENGTLEVSCPYENRDKLINVVIPSEVNGVPVTSIHYSAFYSCHNLKTVKIPDSVTSIGLVAFTSCENLVEIDVDEKNPNYCSVEGVFFNKDKTTLLQYPAGNGRENYEIPEGVTSIRGNVDGGKVIYGSAFQSSNNLKCVTIPGSITEFKGPFGGCTNLTTVIISEGVTTIGSEAFRFCSNLTSVTIPDSVTTIGVYAFGDCASLTSVILPKGVTEIEEKAFYGCISLTSITIPESITSIKDGTFFNCTNLSSVIMPEGITSIGESAFYQCVNLSYMVLPNSITTIGSSAFGGCTSLISVTLPDSATLIERSAFSGCTGLSEINVGSGNPAYCSIDGVWFSKDKTLLIQYPVSNPRKDYEIPNGVTTIDSNSFFGCDNLTSLIMPYGVTSIGVNAFNRCQNLKFVKIPKSVLTIGKNAFYKCSNLTSVTIPNGVTTIEECTFEDCTSLKSVTIPDSVESIGSSAFENTSIENVRLPRNITKINSYTFYNCQALKTIKFPKSIKEVAYSAFVKLNISDVYYEGSEEDWAKIGWLGYHSGDVDDEDNWWDDHWNIEDIFNPTYTYGVMLGETMHYNIPYDELPRDSTVIVTIPKNSENSPETTNMQVSLSLGGNTLDTFPINDDGTLELSGIPDGEYTFTFSADHCAPRSYTASILSGTLSGLENGVELRLYGDTDDAGDGIVDIRDVAKANKYFKTGEGLSGYLLIVSDVNGDGVIDIRDVARMNAHFKNAGNLWE